MKIIIKDGEEMEWWNGQRKNIEYSKKLLENKFFDKTLNSEFVKFRVEERECKTATQNRTEWKGRQNCKTGKGRSGRRKYKRDACYKLQSCQEMNRIVGIREDCF